MYLESMEIRKKYIYDLPTRILHAGIGGASLLLFISAQLAKFFYENGEIRHLFWITHIFIGYLLFAFFALRVVWFFKGPKYSRLSNLIKIREWKKIITDIFIAKKVKPIKWDWGHHPRASIAYLALYFTIAFLIFSGLFLSRIQFDMGPMARKYYDEVILLDTFLESHSIASWFIILFTITHIAALYWHQIKDKVPIFTSMRTGYQYKHTQHGDLENEND